MNSESLRDKVAVVTGASSGIGAAVARKLVREGAHVALAARRESGLLDVQAGLTGGGGEVRSMVATTDVAVRDQVKLLVARTEEELGPVDVLVNCARIMYYTLV
jgi:NAD(P)-dependent dehydrogenase (short-subunit alcohol dehydrogenase family)